MARQENTSNHSPGQERGKVARIFQGILEMATGITPEVKQRFADEDICLRCGKCCHSAVKVKDQMVMLPLQCKYLAKDREGGTFCTVYNIRDLTGWCQRINVESVRKELFPPECPYMEGVSGYKGKIELSDEEFDEIKPILRNIFRAIDRPEYLRKKDWDWFLEEVLELPEAKVRRLHSAMGR